MKPSAPKTEDSLQDLIARFPEVVAGGDEELLLVQREKTVPDMMDGSGRWSLDHLFVSRSAVPVLVEVKRASDTRIRREVVGQLLDYAANGVAYWEAGLLQSSFVKQCEKANVDADLLLAEFLDDDSPEDFWAQVDSNLSAGRVRLVIAADEIPKELARILEFLNEQMKATVLGVELKYFESEDGRRTLAPRLIGETERAATNKTSASRNLPPITVEDWIAEHVTPAGPDAARGVENYLNLMRDLGANISVATTQGSLVTTFETEDGKKAYPFFIGKNGRGSIGFGWLSHRPALKEEAVRAGFLKQFESVIGPLTTQNINGHPGFELAHFADLETFHRFKDIAQNLILIAKRGAS